jgi:hypothetical protein
MNKVHFKCILLLFLIFNIELLFAEDAEDTANESVIVPFAEKIALGFSGKYNMGIFSQHSVGYKHRPDTYRTDAPWNIGLAIRYKNIAAQLFIPTSLDDNSFNTTLNLYFKKMYYEAHIKYYKSFYLGNEKRNIEHKNVGLDILSSGMKAGWVYSYKNHSLRSVFTMSERQTASSGSFLCGLGVFYTSIHSQNEFMPRYAERQHIIYFGPSTGYSYTWIFSHNMFLNIGFTTEANLGININDTKILFIPQINPKITFGHHDGSWSVNMIMGCNTSFLLWGGNSFDVLTPATMSVTFSKRL